ncbi:MAG TPA: serine/threonine-protein kinase, partial [Vicinamibacteria bacterium]|nr:serine/threonine-protein kinase [Vicinamibacteria bacterium]
LKTVAPALVSHADSRARFLREAQAAARLTHPNIVTIYELGEADGALFIAMELLEGTDLAQLTAGRSPLSLDQKVRIVVDICRGLDYAHKQGVFHRDVKPANIRITTDGTVKVVDFGIAQVSEAASLTRTGVVLGTPSYMAPEVLEGARFDPRADMWAVGVILYELLAGRRPFEGPTITALVYKMVHGSPRPLEGEALGLPPALVDAVKKALARQPDDRFPDLQAMAQTLELSMGFTGREAPLPPAVREHAYERNYKEARQRLADSDLEGALAAARRAQALSPARTGIVSLISAIETQLSQADEVRRPARVSVAATTTLSGGSAVATATPPLPSAPGSSLGSEPTPVLAELRRVGAAAFRELGTFGEPPATHASCPSPVRDLIALAGGDGAIRLWDLRSRTKIATLSSEMRQRTGHDAVATSLAFSPDGGLLASGHIDGLARLWDVSRGEEIPVRLRHEAPVSALTFSPDGGTLASGSHDANVRLWDVGAALSGEARRELHRQPAAVTAIAYGLGGDTLLTGHANRNLRLIDARSGRLLVTLRGPEAQVSLLVLAPDGRHVAVGSHDKTIRLFDLEAQKQTAVLTGHKKPVTSLTFLAEGLHLASVAQENQVQIWDAHSGAPLAALWGASAEVFTGVSLFGGDDHLAIALGDGRIRVFGPAS